MKVTPFLNIDELMEFVGCYLRGNSYLRVTMTNALEDGGGCLALRWMFGFDTIDNDGTLAARLSMECLSARNAELLRG